MTRSELIADVALRMDEITPEAGLSLTVDGADQNPLYALIDGLLDAGALELYSVAPYWRLPLTDFDEGDITVENIEGVEGRQYIAITPGDDFLRIGAIVCKSLQRPITEVYHEQSAMGKRQHNRFLMGREAKPVAIMTYTAGGREIQCYSVATSENIAATDVHASYVEKPAIEGTGPISIPDLLIPALEWLVAARAFGARGDVEHANICQQNAQNLLV